MIVGLVSHGKAFALELTAALAVDPQAIDRTVSLAVVLEDPAHVVKHLHDRIAKGERAVYRISFCYPAVGRYIGVSFVGSSVFSSAPSAALALCTGLWYTGTSSLGLGSGSIGAGVSCTGCSFACLWDIGHAPTRRLAYLLLGAIRSDKRRTSIRSLFLMWKNTVKSQMR